MLCLQTRYSTPGITNVCPLYVSGLAEIVEAIRIMHFRSTRGTAGGARAGGSDISFRQVIASDRETDS